MGNFNHAQFESVSDCAEEYAKCIADIKWTFWEVAAFDNEKSMSCSQTAAKKGEDQNIIEAIGDASLSKKNPEKELITTAMTVKFDNYMPKYSQLTIHHLRWLAS